MDEQITIGGHEYSIGKMNAIKQFHLARRLAPAIAAISSVYVHPGGTGDANGADFFAAIAGPLSSALASMSDEEVEQIIFPCLAVVQRKDGAAWAPVKAKGQNALMYQDINAGELLQLVIAVAKENLGSFFPGAQPESKQPAA